MRRVLAALLLTALVAYHASSVLSMWGKAYDRAWGADFASFYYAERVAAHGKNPYDTALLDTAARRDLTRRVVYPFFYPPPFLLTMAWTLRLKLHPAYLAWFWWDEAFALLCGVLLWRWWAGFGPPVPWLVAVAIATASCIPDNHGMGQVNLPVLAMVLGGLWAEERGRPGLGGFLVGLAAMLKMSPALFIAWWALHGRWRAVAWACGTAVGLTLASLVVAGPAVQADFYLRVLPSFGTGDYNGLRVPITLFENYSLAAYYFRLFGGAASAHRLAGIAHVLAVITALVLVGGLAWLFRRAPQDAWALAGQVSAVCLAILLVPVYTYEHHLVWALPAVVLLGTALLRGALPLWTALVIVPAWIGWAWSLPQLQAVARTSPALGELLHDAKTWSLLVLLVGCTHLGRGGAVVPSRHG